jgi:hypothetical protein
MSRNPTDYEFRRTSEVEYRLAYLLGSIVEEGIAAVDRSVVTYQVSWGIVAA